MRALNETDEESGVPMTPLIDVVFLLLIFFLVATTFHKVEDDLSVNLPSASGGVQTEDREQQFVINVRTGGLLVLNGQIVTFDQLADQLAAAAKRDRKTAVVIRGDRKAYHEEIVRILNASIQNNLTNVNIAVYPMDEQSAAVGAAGIK